MRRATTSPRARARSAVALAGILGLALALGVVVATPSAATSGWSRIPHADPLLGGTGNLEMASVSSTPSGFVAVGTDSALTAGAVWFSPDGTNWTRAVHQEGIFGGPDLQYMYDVSPGLGNANGPGNTVIVGSSGPTGDQDAAAWTGGGTVWKRAKHDESTLGGTGSQVMYSVAAAGPGLVAVGTEDPGGDLDAAVWTSEWGTVWTRVPHVEAIFGGPHRQWMKGVTAGGPGVVAVGMDESVDGSSDAAVWTSVDGTTWTQVPHNEAIFGGPGNLSMYGVTAGGPGLVAVGHEITNNESDAAVWTSVDGLTWSRVRHDEAIFGGPSNQSMLDVTVGGPGLIAVGYDNDGTDRDAAVWTSVDGLTWTRVPHDEATFGGPEIETMRGIAVNAAGFGVAAGTQWANYDYDAALWTYSASAPPPPPSASPRSQSAVPSTPDGSAPVPTSTPSPDATAGPSSGEAPSDVEAEASGDASGDASGGNVGLYVGAGFAVLVAAAGFLGWTLARRRL